MTNTPAIEIRNLDVVYNEHTSNEVIALRNFSLKVKKGEILVITGGNGTGKSTLLKAIAGTVPLKSGQILVDGVDITNWSAIKRAKIMGFVHQDTMLGTCPNLTINENFQLTDAKKWWLPTPYQLSLTETQIQTIKETGLPLEARGDTKITMLSGGQRQAISICLSFENKKDILLLDEFTSALDNNTSKQILDFTFKRAKSNHSTVIMVMHNTSSINNYSVTQFSL